VTVDLVEELRRAVRGMWATPETRDAFHEAAEEIERLREALEKIRDHKPDPGFGWSCKAIASSALRADENVIELSEEDARKFCLLGA